MRVTAAGATALALRQLPHPTERQRRVLQVPADGQHGRRVGHVELQLDRQRGEPRARRSTCGPSGPTRTIESSTGRTIGRLWVSSTSAIGPSRRWASSMAIAIGSSERLPLVQTNRPPHGRHQQMVQRRVGQHHAQIRIAGGDAGTMRGERGEGRGERE